MTDKNIIKDIRHRLEAAGFFTLMGVFRMLGIDGARALAIFIAKTLGPRVGVEHRANTNLDLCLPDLSPAERRELLDKMWENLGATFAEYAHLDKFEAYTDGARITVSGTEHVDAVKASGKGALFVSGHFANWELLPVAASRAGLSGAEVYRAPNNPYIDKWLIDQRTKHIYQDQVPKGADGAKQLIKVLRNNKTIMMLIDQKMNDGIAAPFFGYEAMSPPAAAQLALKFGVPIIPASIRRGPNSTFHVAVQQPIWVTDENGKTAAIAEAMEKLNLWLEKEIRACPEQWLWLHRRFPKGTTPAARHTAPGSLATASLAQSTD